MKPEYLKIFKKKKKIRSQLLFITIVAISIYMLTATGGAIWQNYKINHEITKLKDEIAQLQEEGHALHHLIAYRGTESFKEREARRKLGYKKPGEQVLAIPRSSSSIIESGQTKEDEDIIDKAKLTNPQKWRDYIFG